MLASQRRLRVLQVKMFVPLFAIVACPRWAAAQAVEQPKPGPEHKQLERWVGKWTYSGEAHANPFQPAGKFNGALTRRMVLGGFFLEEHWEDKGESGYLAQGIFLTGHDPKTKKFIQYSFENDGSANPFSVTIDGNSWSGKGTRTDRRGKAHDLRVASQLSEDGTTERGKMEYSSDAGKTWKPWFDIMFKKEAE
jgi:hypothetical protein